MPRPIVAHVYPQRLAHNLARVRSYAPAAKIWAVIKANAYGHGIERMFAGLADADGLAMLDIAEAEKVRQLGWHKPVMLLEGCFSAADWAVAQALDLTCVVHCEEQLQWLSANHGGAPIAVLLKMNSGMNRLGFTAANFAHAHARLVTMAGVKSLGMMTHFADADGARGVAMPLSIFANASQGLSGPMSLANSATILRYPEAHADWVRPGIMLYGASPFGVSQPASQFGLQATMSLHSRLIDIQTLNPGESVGYGSTFTAKQTTQIGVVACGYADGYPRHAPNGTPVLVNGVRCALAGRISMDMLTVDLTPVPQAQIGSTVELWGDTLSIDEVAQSAGTIGYELMCALAARVPVITMP